MYSKNEYFKSEIGTLGARVDLAWNSIINSEVSRKEKRDAFEFLAFAFDLDCYENPEIPLEDQIGLMMYEREQFKDDNAEYIPNQAPKFLDDINIEPSIRMFSKSSGQNANDPEAIGDALRNKDLLGLTRVGRGKDERSSGISYLEAEERAKHQLLLKDGRFYHEGEIFDSSRYTSHGRKGYVAYTLNANGEISFFNHLCFKRQKNGDLLFHSSMNKGAPVVSAGELKIKDGLLKEITTLSGHYHPSLFNVFRVLSHFEDKKVDLDEVNVLTQNKVSIQVSANTRVSPKEYYGGKLYQTPALDLLDFFKQQFNENIGMLNQYKKGDFKHNFLRLIGYRLTVNRGELAEKFARDIEEIFKADHLEPEEKIDCIRGLTEAYIKDNNAYGRDYGKEENSGKLGHIFCLFKEKIIEAEDQVSEQVLEERFSSYKNTY